MSGVPQAQIVSSLSLCKRWGFMCMCIPCEAISASTSRGKLRGVTSPVKSGLNTPRVIEGGGTMLNFRDHHLYRNVHPVGEANDATGKAVP